MREVFLWFRYTTIFVLPVLMAGSGIQRADADESSSVDPRLKSALEFWATGEYEVSCTEGWCSLVSETEDSEDPVRSYRVKFKRCPDSVVGEWIRTDEGKGGMAKAGGWNSSYFFFLNRNQEPPPWRLETSGPIDELSLTGRGVLQTSNHVVEILDCGVCRLLDAPFSFAGQPLSKIFSSPELTIKDFTESSKDDSKIVSIEFDYDCEIALPEGDVAIRFFNSKIELMPDRQWCVRRWKTAVTTTLPGEPKQGPDEISCEVTYATSDDKAPKASWTEFPVIQEVVSVRKNEHGAPIETCTLKFIEIGQRAIPDGEFRLGAFHLPEWKPESSGLVFWFFNAICVFAVGGAFWYVRSRKH